MQKFPCSEYGGLTAEKIMEQAHCWNDSSISTTINHPQYKVRGPGWSVSWVRETLDSVPRGQTKGKQHSGSRIGLCVCQSKQLRGCLISSLHADHCSEFHSRFSGCHELPVLGMVTRHKSWDPEGHKSHSFFSSFPWLLPFLRLWPPPSAPWKKQINHLQTKMKTWAFPTLWMVFPCLWQNSRKSAKCQFSLWILILLSTQPWALGSKKPLSSCYQWPWKRKGRHFVSLKGMCQRK